MNISLEIGKIFNKAMDELWIEKEDKDGLAKRSELSSGDEPGGEKQRTS